MTDTLDVLAGLVEPAAWIVHSPTRLSQFDEYPCLYAAGRKNDAQNHARLMGAKCEPLFASLDTDKLRALMAAAILDAQMRVFEQKRLDTPDEIRSAARTALQAPPK
jgi:hypothetical protein